jgi:hypothetical protein
MCLSLSCGELQDQKTLWLAGFGGGGPSARAGKAAGAGRACDFGGRAAKVELQPRNGFKSANAANLTAVGDQNQETISSVRRCRRSARMIQSSRLGRIEIWTLRDDEERNTIRERWVLHAVPEKSVGVGCVGSGKERGEEEENLGCEAAKETTGMGSVFGPSLFRSWRAKTGALTTSAPSRTQGNFILERRIKTPGRVAGQARLALPKGVQGAGRWVGGGEWRGPAPNGETRTAKMGAAWKRRMELGMGMDWGDGDGTGALTDQSAEPGNGAKRWARQEGEGDRDGDGGRDKRRKWIQSTLQSGRKHVARPQASSWCRMGCVIRTPWSMTCHAFAVMYSAESDMTAGWNPEAEMRGQRRKGESGRSSSAASNRIARGSFCHQRRRAAETRLHKPSARFLAPPGDLSVGGRCATGVD